MAAGIYERTPEVRERQRLAMLRRGEMFARGVRTRPSGYIEYTRGPHKGRCEHVVIVEQFIGRRLLPGELVHHKDGNRSNNEISTLELMTRADHARHHALANAALRTRDEAGRFAEGKCRDA